MRIAAERGHSLTLVDNTVNLKEFPSELLDLIPSSTSLLIQRKNSFGRFNKGAGDIHMWGMQLDRLASHNFFFHLEPRLRVLDPERCVAMLDASEDCIYSSGLRQVKTGYFVMRTEMLSQFVHEVRLTRMVMRRFSIEDLLYSFCVKAGIDVLPNVCLAERFDPSASQWAPY